MKYGIACYHRPQCLTLHTLCKLGIPHDDILIAVNCEEDRDEYFRRYGSEFSVLYKEKRNVAGNRNNIISRIGTPCIVLDDDIRAFKRYVPYGSKYGMFTAINERSEFEDIISECFKKAAEHNAPLFGVAASDNTMIAKSHFDKSETYSLNGNFQGGFCGYLSSEVTHDESYDVLDDYELNLRLLAGGRNILRRNDLYAEKGKMGGNAGGCEELYKSGAQQRCMRQLVRQWGPLFKVVGDAKGIRITCSKVRGLS